MLIDVTFENGGLECMQQAGPTIERSAKSVSEVRVICNWAPSSLPPSLSI